MLTTARAFVLTVSSIVAVAATASAAPIVTITEVAGANTAAKRSNKATLLAGLGNYTMLEDFETMTASNTAGHTTLATGAGTFSKSAGALNGTGGACIKAGGNPQTCDQFFVLRAPLSPFDGRYNTTPSVVQGRGHWLDSNDIAGLRLDLGQPRHSLFFFLTDVSDQGGRLTIGAADGTTTQQAIAPTQGSGDLFFVQMASMTGITSVTWSNTRTGDGFGIDDIGTVPEPTSLLLLGVALVATASRLRRRD